MKRNRLCAVFLIILALLSPLKAPGEAQDKAHLSAVGKHSDSFFGTFSMLRLFADTTQSNYAARTEALWNEVKQALAEVENSLSLQVETSDISRFNRLAYGESIAVSAHTANVLQIAAELYTLTGGAFDPTVYPLVDLWGFTPRFRQSGYSPSMPYDRLMENGGFAPPEERYIEAFKRLTGFDGIVLAGDAEKGYTLTKLIPPVTVDGTTYQGGMDLGGIGKGYAADLVGQLMTTHDYSHGFFSCGGSSMSLLRGMTGEEELFELGMGKPRKGLAEGDTYVTVFVSKTAISTSGDYDNAYRIGDTVYCHIIDPRSGYPVNMPVDGVQNGIATATVIGPGAAYCEGLSTALCALPLSEAVSLINQNTEYRAIMAVYSSDSETYEVVTNLLSEEYSILDPAYIDASRIDYEGQLHYEGSLLP